MARKRKQDWSPREGDWPKLRVIANLGDKDPYEHGGFIVFEVVQREGRTIEAELWNEPGEDGQAEVFRFVIEPDVMQDLAWVDWERIASSMLEQASLEQVREMSRSPDPLVRANLYHAVGAYYGWGELDGDPMVMNRAQLLLRWPDFMGER